MTQSVAITSALPESGQIVECRRRRYVVLDVLTGTVTRCRSCDYCGMCSAGASAVPMQF